MRRGFLGARRGLWENQLHLFESRRFQGYIAPVRKRCLDHSRTVGSWQTGSGLKCTSVSQLDKLSRSTLPTYLKDWNCRACCQLSGPVQSRSSRARNQASGCRAAGCRKSSLGQMAAEHGGHTHCSSPTRPARRRQRVTFRGWSIEGLQHCVSARIAPRCTCRTRGLQEQTRQTGPR